MEKSVSRARNYEIDRASLVWYRIYSSYKRLVKKRIHIVSFYYSNDVGLFGLFFYYISQGGGGEGSGHV